MFDFSDAGDKRSNHGDRLRRSERGDDFDRLNRDL